MIKLKPINRDKRFSGLEISLLSGLGDTERKGVSIGGITLQDRMNGMSTGIVSGAETMNGMSIGVISGADNLNGLAAGAINIVTGEVRGALFSPLFNNVREKRVTESSHNSVMGVVIAAFNTVHGKLYGLAIGAMNTLSNEYGPKGEVYGLSAGLINRTDKLTGMQLGIANYSGKYTRGLQIGLLNFVDQGSRIVQIGAINYCPGEKWYSRFSPLIAIRNKRNKINPSMKKGMEKL